MLYKKSHGRRRFLQNAALFSAGLMASVTNTRLAKANNEPVEAIVIGSGFGGAVAALRLGQAGINTLVIERGRRWSITPAQNTFATFRNPDGRSTWLSKSTLFGEPIDVYTGVLETKYEDGITVLAGAGVGGGSLVYNCCIYQPPRNLFYHVFPREVNYDELDRVYYPRVRSMLNAQIIPQDILDTKYYLLTRAFRKQAAEARLPYKLLEMAVNWDIVRQEIDGSKVASTIIGEHWYGINSGAKNSLDRNYLAQAEQSGHVEILPLHIATEILEVPGHGYEVRCNQIDESGEIIATKTFTSKYLFLAAGSMGTSALLLKAKATGTLPYLNNHVGLHWGNNGDALAIRSGFTESTNSGEGGPGPVSVIEYFDNPLGPIAIECGPQWNDPDKVETTLSLSIPSVKGSFNYDSKTGLVGLHWPTDSASLNRAKFAYQLLDRKNSISTRKIETRVAMGSHTLLQKQVTTEIEPTPISAHPLGGAVIGKACDLYGRVFNYKGLYVVDGALIPTSTACTNPSFTIAALAERNLEKILAEDIIN